MKFLVDFHNYGYSILKLSARSAFVVRLARWYEMRYAKKAHKAFCVSKSMQKDLKDSWGIDAVVVYDRPNTEVFKPISIEAKH
jgi:beta-1,4-mannosyltransferase